MNTRTFSRTMQAAFGPYTDNRLHPMHDSRPMRLSDKVMYAISAVALVVVAMVVIFGA